MLPDAVAVPRVVQPVPVIVVEGVDGAVVVGVTVEIVGVVVPRVPSDTLGIGTAAAELTPRLAISEEPSGIPVRGLPPGVVGVVEVGVVSDVAMSLEGNPHNPDTPIVPIVEVVDIPVIGSIPGSVDVADGADIPAVAVLLDAVVPDVAAVAAVADPIVYWTAELGGGALTEGNWGQCGLWIGSRTWSNGIASRSLRRICWMMRARASRLSGARAISRAAACSRYGL
jgi:hypothetical protein